MPGVVQKWGRGFKGCEYEPLKLGDSELIEGTPQIEDMLAKRG